MRTDLLDDADVLMADGGGSLEGVETALRRRTSRSRSCGTEAGRRRHDKDLQDKWAPDCLRTGASQPDLLSAPFDWRPGGWCCTLDPGDLDQGSDT
jgi:hypothetical protein